MRSIQKQVVSFLIGILLLGFYTSDAFAQSQINEQLEIEAFIGDTTLYLGDWVIESTVNVYSISSTTDSIAWIFDSPTGLLKITSLADESLIVEFARLPINFPKTFRLHSKVEATNQEFNDEESQLNEGSQESSDFNSALTQSGSLSRGIIVGSNQDFALESGLNFELRGQLTDDISLDAVLTDQSIPIQPDGTTQSIREFDKVLIRLQSEKAALEMGDVDVSLQQSTFAKLNRRLQGASGTYQSDQGSIKAALSSVRGTFVTQQFFGEDGVQGPYRLRGKNGEEFIIVLAGTERVYINGIQVQRGEEHAYIIDYGLGEITFTNNIFIKDETRIFVEYEYIDQDFNRTLVAAEAQDSFFEDRLRVGVSVIRQADGDELLSQQTLSEQDIRILQGVGDDLNDALVSGIISNPSDDVPNVRYAQVDTTVNGQIISIFKNIPNSPNSNLVVRFLNVGSGNGSYERVGDTINGLLYNWVGPGNGSYEPFRRLPAPQKHQMMALNTDYVLSDKFSLAGELAFSSFDRNRFSGLDNGDNNDLAFQSSLNGKELDLGFAALDVSYHRRQSGKNFEFFERTREVEFDRKWNLNALDISGEILDEFDAQLNFSDRSKVGVGVGALSFDGFESVRQNTHLEVKETDKLGIDYSQEYVSSDNKFIGSNGEWFRQIGRIQSRITTNFTPFIHFEHEDRRERNEAFQLTQSSLKIYELGPGIGYSDQKLKVSMAYIFRNEEGVNDGRFRKLATATEQRYQVGYRTGNGLDTENSVHFRTKNITALFESTRNADQNGFQINSRTSFLRDNFSSRLIYKANTQRQAIRQEAYIEVGPELGQFVWIDENENGIEEIDEFYPELSPNEGTYVLQFLPSDDLLPVINLNTRLTLDWQPFQSNEPKKWIPFWLQSIRLTSLVDLRENSISEAESDIYLLKLESFRNDSTTLDGAIRIEQGLELDATEQMSFRINYSTSNTLTKRTTELQQKNANQVFLDAKYQFNRDLRLQLDASVGDNMLQSDELFSRTYNIRFWSVNPGVTSRVSRSLQLGVYAGYGVKEDQQFEVVQARTIKLRASTRAFLWKKVQTSSNLEVRDTQLNGSSTPFINFELTEGTGIGTNLVWSLSANYRINNLVRMNFTYDGRTVQDRPDIHTIKLVVSAVF